MVSSSELAAKGKSVKTKPESRASAKGDLSRYRQMRDFSKTPEPRGEARLQPAEGLRFVIQKHAARRLHYDLRLELDGVFKSWAVTRGPSLDPREKRLAVQVEDHPIDYGDFEGVIPKGEYGGGTVMIWDRGHWLPEGDPEKGYAKGHLAFQLNGEKLHGRWHLVRIKRRPGEKKDQWLLFKSEDEYARPSEQGDILQEAPDSAATHRSMDKIAQEQSAVWSSNGGLVKGELSSASNLSPQTRGKRKSPPSEAKTLKTSSIAGARKAAFPRSVDPCLALLTEKPPQGDAWLHEIKFDGYRLIVSIRDGDVRLLTRKGLDWTKRFPAIAEAFANFAAGSAIVDGEAVVEDEHAVSSFSALQEALSGPGQATAAIFYAFDLLYLDGYDLREATLDDRKDALSKLLVLNTNSALRYSDHIIGSGQEMLDHSCRLGLEGIVSKRRNSPYRSGRHGEWLKIKCTDREEFVIGGYVPSTASKNSIGSLALGYYQNGRLFYAGRVGTGFTHRLAQGLFAQLQMLRIAKSPFVNALSTDERRGLLYVEPKLVAEVEFRGWTHDRHLRQAAFKGLREDKPALEVELEIPNKGVMQEKEGTAKPAQKETERSGKSSKWDTVEFAGIKLTHPDRILWEGQGVTKLGLAEYYAEVADYILPHIVKRPLALVRCPNGSKGECFFQKHSFAGLTDAVEIVRVPEKDAEAETIVIHDLRGLINLVQANVLEIHPWGARIEDIEHPDTLIFDLDPGEGVSWNAVIEAARQVRMRLLDAGIESYVKTSGGKGLHVVSHLAPEVDWDALKDFAHGIALAMERDEPAKYVSTMAKKARGGKIFVDYLRNGRGATAVAPYSTRARQRAPVSTPISWDELDPAMTASRFTVDNIGRRLAALKADPWRGFLANPQPIGKAVAADGPAGSRPKARSRTRKTPAK